MSVKKSLRDAVGVLIVIDMLMVSAVLAVSTEFSKAPAPKINVSKRTIQCA